MLNIMRLSGFESSPLTMKLNQVTFVVMNETQDNFYVNMNFLMSGSSFSSSWSISLRRYRDDQIVYVSLSISIV